MFTHEGGKATVNPIMASILYEHKLLLLECHASIWKKTSHRKSLKEEGPLKKNNLER